MSTGESRAAYGKQQQVLSKRLVDRLGKGFDVTNLHNKRGFYEVFSIRDAVRLELSWAHYRSLLRIEKASAHNWYL